MYFSRKTQRTEKRKVTTQHTEGKKEKYRKKTGRWKRARFVTSRYADAGVDDCSLQERRGSGTGRGGPDRWRGRREIVILRWWCEACLLVFCFWWLVVCVFDLRVVRSSPSSSKKSQFDFSADMLVGSVPLCCSVRSLICRSVGSRIPAVLSFPSSSSSLLPHKTRR